MAETKSGYLGTNVEYKVYILKSLKNNHYYIGQTEKLAKRIQEHNLGTSRSTKSGIPWKLVYEESYDSKREAIKRETQLKKIKNRHIIEQIIAG